MLNWYVVFFFKQKTAYEMRISDWSSDVCSSDLLGGGLVAVIGAEGALAVNAGSFLVSAFLLLGLRGSKAAQRADQVNTVRTSLGNAIGSASCRERVCQYV